MSVINAAQASQESQKGQSSAKSSASGSGKSGNASTQFVGEEFNNFLKLLTAQLRNQDPMSPLDSTQFVEQLASFSTLEQQVQSNESLKSVASMIGDLHAMYASEWLGQTVTVPSSWVPYSGDDIEFMVDAPAKATHGVLKIETSGGAEVLEEKIDLSADRQSWNGHLNNDATAAPGEVYKFSIEVYEGDTLLGTVAPQIVTEVTTVSTENGALRLGTSSGLTADLDQVRKVD